MLQDQVLHKAVWKVHHLLGLIVAQVATLLKVSMETCESWATDGTLVLKDEARKKKQ